jgi:Protein of unknown function (DUF1552)
VSPFKLSSLGRRNFLRGLGTVAVGLPFLEALVPREVRGKSEPIKRFAVFFCCNGVNMQRWFPQGDFGALSAELLSGTANETLAPYVSKLLFPRGVHMSPRGWGLDGGEGDDHGKGMAHKLTAQYADSNWLAMGPSVDQVIAAAVNPGSAGSRKPPLTLRVGRPSQYKDFDYISYTGPSQAVLGINNPWNAYADFMSLGGTAEAPNAASDRIARRRHSVLDLVGEQFKSLSQAPLSAADRVKLDAHFTAVRALETTMTGAGGLLTACADADLTLRAQKFEGSISLGNEDSEYPLIADLQVEIMALAFACDANRVASLQFGSGAAGPVFNWDDINHEYNHHKLSHGKVRDDCFGESTDDGCSNIDNYEDKLFAIDRWYQARFAHLLSRLDAYPEADGRSVLDNSVVLYSNELSDGKTHSFSNMPYILAGSAGGALKQGQHLLLGDGSSYDVEKAPHNRLLNTLVNVMGIESEWFGVPQGSGAETMQGGVFEELLV